MPITTYPGGGGEGREGILWCSCMNTRITVAIIELLTYLLTFVTPGRSTNVKFRTLGE